MKAYSDLNIKFALGGVQFYALNASNTRFTQAIPKHRHSVSSYELHYIRSGYGTAVINGGKYDIIPGTFFVTGPMIEHEQIPKADDPMEEYCIYLRCETKSNKKKNSNDAADIFVSTDFWLGRDESGVGQVMLRLFEEFESDKLGSHDMIQTLLMELVIFAARNYQSVAEDKVVTAKAGNIEDQYLRIEEYFLYGYKDASLDGLAKILRVSVRQTERLLKRYYGQTFQQKKTESKMSAALIMLRSSKKSVTDIAYELGYSSVEHFSNAFKKVNGISPRKYRDEKVE